jgi:hypothetical protein
VQQGVPGRPLVPEAAKRAASPVALRLLVLAGLLAILGGCATPAEDGDGAGRYVGGR